LSGHTDYVHAVTVLRDEKLASGSFDKTFRVWDAKHSKCLMTLHTDFEVDELLSLASGGKLAVLSGKTLIIYE
jgi:WD40 repeat protein